MEIYLRNPWLTYGIGLHRLREAGLAPEVCDDLDERPFSLDEIHEFCKALLLGEDGCVNLPHPRDSLSNFLRTLAVLVEKEKLQWNPVKKKTMAWIDIAKLEAIHRRHRQHDSPRSRQRHTTNNVFPQKQASPRSQPQSRQRHTVNNDFTQRPQTSPRKRHTEAPRQQWRGCDPPASSSWSNAAEAANRRTRHTTNQFSRQESQESAHSRASQESRNSNASSQQQWRGNERPTSSWGAAAEEVNRRTSIRELTLPEILQRWSHKPPDHERWHHSLQELLVTVPNTFPPKNPQVEDHVYFSKWKKVDREAFEDVSGEELNELLKRAVRKARLFLHPDKLPKDLTESQTFLFKTIWYVISEREAAMQT